MGVNRFECRACPYEWTVDRKWYDQTVMKEKEVEQVFGGKDEWANADSVESEIAPRLVWVVVTVMLIILAAQCPAEGCDSDRAYFYQLQIRSADEPMTTFLRVRDLTSLHARRTRISDSWTVLYMCSAVERELVLRAGSAPRTFILSFWCQSLIFGCFYFLGAFCSPPPPPFKRRIHRHGVLVATIIIRL